jgi:3-oxoacyl-[acyl-carrier-protein] synthase-3
MGARITGYGAAVPTQVVTNHDLEQRMDTSDEWIRSRTGITERRWATDEVATGDLAVTSGRVALERAGRTAVDRVILATTTPDHPCPATAPWVAHRLGLGQVPAFDLAAVCSGFLYALATARDAVLAGSADSVLVIGSETYSRLVDRSDRGSAVIFGDGAGAVVVERATDGSDLGRIGPVTMYADGSETDLIVVRNGGSRAAHQGGVPDDYFAMQGQKVFTAAVKRMGAVIQETLATEGWSAADWQWLVGHQANARILQALSRHLKLPMDKVVVDLDLHGNTAGASIPLALAHHADRFTAGDRIVLAAFGGGTTWAASSLVWPGTSTVTAPVAEVEGIVTI